ncbi:DUF397 domain-containing protein [Peterkaempfera bronchialis]|uniref:DUF397 domain-containing protein n=1 Tax=Peterkaempfera bronchialis TaxID=2126346 RepID=UPI003C2AB184
MTGTHAPSADQVPAARWRKSSFSGGGNNCFEVAEGVPGLVPVRDSKDPHGPALLFTHRAFADFLAGLKAGEY